MSIFSDIQNQVKEAIAELLTSFPMDRKHILVIGTSTSEVLGKHIGSSGNQEVAEAIYKGLIEARGNSDFHLAFQGCEHINRALIVEKETAEQFNLDIVSVVPAIKAGGAMSTYAFYQFKQPVVVEFIKADAGLDIGNTLIGMHLKHVAVPVRTTVKKVGEANITVAKTRPKLIGGERAQYSVDNQIKNSSTIYQIKEIGTDNESC